RPARRRGRCRRRPRSARVRAAEPDGAHVPGRRRMRGAVAHFDEHGWVLVPSLVPQADIDAAQAGLFRIYPTPEEVASGVVTDRTAPFLASTADDGGRRFRGEQFTGLRSAPTGDVSLDLLAVHHRILDLVDALLGPHAVLY